MPVKQPNESKSLETKLSFMKVAHELGLPPCVFEDRLLTFSPPEASFYRRMHDDFANALRRIDRLETKAKERDERLVDVSFTSEAPFGPMYALAVLYSGS